MFLSFPAFLIVIDFRRWQMIAGESLGFTGGKSEHHPAACRVEDAGVAVESRGDGKCHRKDTAGSLRESAGKGEKAR